MDEAAQINRIKDLVNDIKRVSNKAIPATEDWNLMPVGKQIIVGPSGGAYYVSKGGNRVYLKKYQRDACARRQLNGDRDNTCSQITFTASEAAAGNGKRGYGHAKKN